MRSQSPWQSTRITQLEDRSVLRVGGPDAGDFLQRIVTQDVTAIAENGALLAMLLTPQGKILCDFILIRLRDGFILDAPSAGVEDLTRRLKLYRLRAKVTIDIDDRQSVFALWPAPDGDFAGPHPGAVSFPDPRLARLGIRAIGPDDALSLDGAIKASAGSYRARRLAQGVAECAIDYPPDAHFPMDLNYDALNGVDYQKGCFIGQEVASRMKRKGELRKRTAVITALETGPLSPGATITADGVALGSVFAVADEKPAPALAVIRMDRFAKQKGACLLCDAHRVKLELPSYLQDA